MTRPADDDEEARRQQRRLVHGTFDLDDFRQQILQMKKLGTVRDVMGQIPGLSPLLSWVFDPDEEVEKFLRIIDHMAAGERRNPDSIKPRRRREIAQQAGVEPADVTDLLRQFEVLAAFVRRVANATSSDKSPRPERTQPNQSLSPEERQALRGRWDTVARTEAEPDKKGPWITAWNRNLLLWDMSVDC
jgi:signal recognition particle GTPase